MICLDPPRTTSRQTRPQVAAIRAASARAMLEECHFCAHHCGVNRLLSSAGRCHAGFVTRFFSAQTEVTDELQLIPAFNVALSGCDLRCDFCITGGPSWNAQSGRAFDATAMGARARRALGEGASCVMVLGGEPTIHLPAVLDFVAELPVNAKLVWKTNGHCSAQARELLEAMFDIWVVDFKFGNDRCGERLAKVRNYLHIVRENLIWASGNSELIVRHLLMPGHLDCCWKPIAEWLALELPRVKISLRTGYWPAWRASRHLELRETLSGEEMKESACFAQDLGLNLIP